MDRNPYAPPRASSDSTDLPDLPATSGEGPRPPGEYVLLVSLAGSFLFIAYQWLSGSLEIRNSDVVAIAIACCFLGVGALSFWLILRRRLTGAILCSVFYGVQVISATQDSGETIGFISLPTINFRIYGDEASPVNLNLVALALFVLSLLLCSVYRQGRTRGE